MHPIAESRSALMDSPSIAIREALNLFNDIEEDVDRGGWGDCEELHPCEIGTPGSNISVPLPPSLALDKEINQGTQTKRVE